MSVARFIADQRTRYRRPHTVTCLLLGVSLAWFYKWNTRTNGPVAESGSHTPRARRRDTIDRAVRVMVTKQRGLHGSPGCTPTCAMMAGRRVRKRSRTRHALPKGVVARRIRRRNGLIRQDKTAPKFPDLLRRDFTAGRPNAHTGLCRQRGIRQSMSRDGPCFDNAAAEAFPQLAGAGAPLTPPVHRHPSHSDHRLGLVLRVPQPPAPAQHEHHDEPGQPRKHHDPRPGNHTRKPSTTQKKPQE